MALFVLIGLALSWLTVAFGLLAKTPSGANGLSLLLLLLPFVSSAFVPTSTMPAAVAAFAGHQPFTPMIDTLRGLLVGGATAGQAAEAVLWCLAIATAGFFWSMRLYNRGTAGAG